MRPGSVAAGWWAKGFLPPGPESGRRGGVGQAAGNGSRAADRRYAPLRESRTASFSLMRADLPERPRR